MTQAKLSVLLVLMTCTTMSFSYPTGAPISACQTMMPGHVGVYPQPNPAPYIMKINSSFYQSGKAIQVQIMGPPYRGILLEARTYSKTTLYGTWFPPPNNTKILPCPGNLVGAITHSNTNLKDETTTYIWMPPDSDCPNVLYIIATVAEAYNIYWLGVRSALISKDPATTCRSNGIAGQSNLFGGGMAWHPAIYSILCFLLVFLLV
ncbi:putative defense protein 3 [Dendropsophus ebraccatus]|uniref:putative defense protein 3 n=1 Tax=Dendropsophus ebraccatus TaxID=150705 RepID=UPI0038310D80